jgi:hypothetical protein
MRIQREQGDSSSHRALAFLHPAQAGHEPFTKKKKKKSVITLHRAGTEHTQGTGANQKI